MMTIIITACVGRTIISDAILSLEEFGPQRRYNWMLELVIIIHQHHHHHHYHHQLKGLVEVVWIIFLEFIAYTLFNNLGFNWCFRINQNKDFTNCIFLNNSIPELLVSDIAFGKQCIAMGAFFFGIFAVIPTNWNRDCLSGLSRLGFKPDLPILFVWGWKIQNLLISARLSFDGFGI